MRSPSSGQGSAKIASARSSGRGVAINWVKAYMWLDLAVTSGYVDAAQPLDYAASRLSQAEMEQARQLGRAWRAAHPAASAAGR